MKVISMSFTFWIMCLSQTLSLCSSQKNSGREMASFEDVANSVRQIFFSNEKYNLRNGKPAYFSARDRDDIVHKVTVAFLETEGIRLHKDTPRASKHLQHDPLSSSTQYIRFKQTSSLASSSAQQMRSKDPLGLDSAAKWVKSGLDGLGANLSPKAIPRPPINHLPILNLVGCYDTIKGFIKTPCQSTAKADVKIIMKQFISSGRAAIASGGEHGAPTKKIFGLTSALSECIFGNVCAGKSFQ